MKTSAVIRIVIWSAVALLLISFLVAGMSGAFPNFSFRNWIFYRLPSNATGERYTAGGGSVNASDITELDIQWVDGTVDIVQNETIDQILFNETANKPLEKQYQLQYSVNNGRLTIRFCEERAVWGLFNWSANKRLTVEIPANKEFNKIMVDTTSAPFEAANIRAGDIELETVSGSIMLTSATCQSLRVNAVSGALRAGDLRAATISSENVSGRTQLQGIFEKVDCESVSGSILVDADHTLKKMEAESISGSIKLLLPENDGFTAKYSSASGGFHCNDFPVQIAEKKAVYQDGGIDIRLSTVSGSMNIEKR